MAPMETFQYASGSNMPSMIHNLRQILVSVLLMYSLLCSNLASARHHTSSSSFLSSTVKSSSTFTKTSSTTAKLSLPSLKSSSTTKLSTSTIKKTSSIINTSTTKSQLLTRSSSSAHLSATGTLKVSTTRLTTSTTPTNTSLSSKTTKSQSSSKISLSSTSGSTTRISTTSASTTKSTSKETSRSSTSTRKLSSATGTSTSTSTSTATACPNFYNYKTYDLVSLNTTNTAFTYGYFGTNDETLHRPSSISYMAIWTTENVTAYSIPDPDVIYYIGTPGIAQAIYPNGTNLVVDSHTGITTVSNCKSLITFSSGNGTQSTKRNIETHQIQETERDSVLRPRQIASSITVVVHTLNECGYPSPAVPKIYCLDSTPDESPLLSTATLVSDQEIISSGTVSATCYFVPPNYNLLHQATCSVAFPIITNLCKVNEGMNPPELPSAAERCKQAVEDASVEEPEAASGMATCNAIEMMDNFCKIQQDSDVKRWKDWLCGTTKPETDITITLWDPAAINGGGLGNSVIIGSVSSQAVNPPPINYDYQRPKPDGSLECGPCSAKKAGELGQQSLAFWQEALRGTNFDNGSPDLSERYYAGSDSWNGISAQQATINCENEVKPLLGPGNNVSILVQDAVVVFNSNPPQETTMCFFYHRYINAGDFWGEDVLQYPWYHETVETVGYNYIYETLQCHGTG